MIVDIKLLEESITGEDNSNELSLELWMIVVPAALVVMIIIILLCIICLM